MCEIADGGRNKVLLAAGRLKQFRACMGTIKRAPKKGICIDQLAADLLEVGVGDKVMVIAR